ncbi:MAG: Hsp20/alpha crystallin family protein [Anaerolineae bacterium]|nr:Hsp20/alpha crystallin family protein [Anaerolineae bacterium]
MALMRVAPRSDWMDLQRAMNRMFEEDWDNGGSRVARLPLDTYSTENEIVLKAAIPGVDPDAVEITVEGDTLTISGEMPGRLEGVDYLFSERFHGAFKRTLKLNVPIDVDEIEASFENGELTLVLPKAEEIRPKVIKVSAAK